MMVEIVCDDILESDPNPLKQTSKSNEMNLVRKKKISLSL